MVNYLKCCKWKVSSILWSNHQHQQRPSEKWGCTRNKGMQIMFSSTPNSAQEEPNSVQIFCFSTLHYSDNREVPCIATVPWFSWVTSFDEWWVTLIQTNQTIECLNCMVNIVIIAHSDKIVCSICFWYDLLVVMNVIRKLFWFMFIYLLDYPANTMKQETFHQVKWWYIWKCSLLCQVPAMTPSSSSE